MCTQFQSKMTFCITNPLGTPFSSLKFYRTFCPARFWILSDRRDFYRICPVDRRTFGNTDVFVKHGCPRRQQSQTMAKISKSYILTPPHPQGHVMSVKYEQPLDELTVQVWLLYDHPNFKYCTLFISGGKRTELRKDRQTDGRGQTDNPNTRCPRRTFQAGGIKIFGTSSCTSQHL